MENCNCEFKDSHIHFCELHDAAPDLLKALKHAENRLDAIPHNYVNTNFKMIREAIAKAEGR